MVYQMFGIPGPDGNFLSKLTRGMTLLAQTGLAKSSVGVLEMMSQPAYGVCEKTLLRKTTHVFARLHAGCRWTDQAPPTAPLPSTCNLCACRVPEGKFTTSGEVEPLQESLCRRRRCTLAEVTRLSASGRVRPIRKLRIHKLRIRKLRISSLNFWEIPFGPRNSTPSNQESDRVKALKFQILTGTGLMGT